MTKFEERSRKLRQATQEYQRRVNLSYCKIPEDEMRETNRIAREIVVMLSNMVRFSGDGKEPSKLPITQAKIEELESAIKRRHV